MQTNRNKEAHYLQGVPKSATAGWGRRGLGLILLLVISLCLPAVAFAKKKQPVYIGLDAEFSFKGSTSAQAIRTGIQIAIDEINAAGGVLGGRPLELVEKDNRIVPGRSRENLREFAAIPGLVAVMCGRFSPTVVETIKDLHDLKLPLLDPWAAADGIIDHAFKPSYTFRLSLRDSWAMPVIADAANKSGLRNLGLLFLNTSWGRSNELALTSHIARKPNVRIVGVRWINNLEPEESIMRKYRELVADGAQAIVLVTNNNEAVALVRGVANLEPTQRRHIYSHWGITGGEFFTSVGDAMSKVDIEIIQTYTFIGATRPKSKQVAVAATRMLNVDDVRRIPSPVGLAHAYDLTHILARAIDLAKSTDRPSIRDALEKVRGYRGLIRDYEQPFSATRHEALLPGNVFLSRFAADGALEPIISQPLKRKR